ncbi:MAG: hypothetical protein Fur0041_17030 [Bacteroidia bacterium]
MRILAAILTFIFSFFLSGRDADFTIQETAGFIATDNLGNVYLVSGDRIRKFDNHGIFQKEFSNKNFGPVSSLDATNPLRLTAFYKDFNRVLFLDNTLTQNGDAIELEKMGFPIATLACSSFDNGMWIYNQPGFELVRFNRNMEIVQRTGNLSQILGIELQPDFLIEKDNKLFLNNPETGILVFDVFGTYAKTVPLKGIHSFQVMDNSICWFEKGRLHSWSVPLSEITDFEEPVNDSALNMKMEKEVIFVQEKNAIKLYKR